MFNIEKTIRDLDKYMKNFEASWAARDRYRITFWEFLNLPVSEILKFWI